MSEISPKVAIVDYGMGNLFNLEKVIRHLGGAPHFAENSSAVHSAERLILPGVGAFGDGIANLQKMGFVEPLVKFAKSGRPFLGICLGMQLFMTQSEEFGLHQGLNLIAGRVQRLPNPGPSGLFYKIPHVGWNALEVSDSRKGIKSNAAGRWAGTIFQKLDEGACVYFVHSFIVVPRSPSVVLSETAYGNNNFCSALQQGNLSGCQFHPELSGESGLQILRNFLFN